MAGARVSVRLGERVPVPFAAAEDGPTGLPQGASARRQGVPGVVHRRGQGNGGRNSHEAPAHHVVPGTHKTRRQPRVLHDGLLCFAAGVEGTHRDRGDELRARLPEADVLSEDARGADRLQAGRGNRKPARHDRLSRGRGPHGLVGCERRRSGRRARSLGRVDSGQARGVSQYERRVPWIGAGDQVPGDERGGARPELGVQKLSHARMSFAASRRRPGVHLSQRQQGSRAGPPEVRLRVERVA